MIGGAQHKVVLDESWFRAYYDGVVSLELPIRQTSIWVGVGGTGIAVSGGITQEYGHAHNMCIDELARYGLLGFITQFFALGIGLFILLKAAIRGLAGPLALAAAFAVTELTEPRNDWVHPSVTEFMVILAVAGDELASERTDDKGRSVLKSGHQLFS